MALDQRIPDIEAASAGTRAVIGHAIHDQAALVLRQLGGEVSGFAARQLTAKMVVGADLILTMTAVHRDAVLELAPQKLKRTFRLAEASAMASELGATSVGDLASLRPQLEQNSRLDVIDPINQSSEVFEDVGETIARLLPPILDVCARSTR